MSDECCEDVHVYVLVGRASRAGPLADGYDPSEDENDAVPVNVLLTATDEGAAISRALAALANEGYGRAELDRIGIVDGEPDDPTFAAAYWDAIDGEVAVIAFHG
ncbi:hypothetical protein EDC22_12011 [Tepidamorphus gemmatus]|uniref:Transcriptional regulator n=1 Tax=Tepidamorphus gemmatus TaxID=747076 RepID=A0A4V2UXF8_9HYPH|nr:transcriptional regulator [Tepidamorphus gemmatus]TCT03338.1 hypothetical protein EDC22_12011 [Tepidamorphus gemmatus]